MPDYELVLHNITPDKVAFCYRAGDADSLEVANYYRTMRKLPAENLIALPCVSNRSISETEYVTQIEEPLIRAINELSGTYSSAEFSAQPADSTSHPLTRIWVIVLGMNVPNVYIDGSGQEIAIASRIHRLGKAHEAKIQNHFYDKQVFRFFNQSDARKVYITAVLDGPTKEIVKKLIYQSVDIDNREFISGKFYIDPYGLTDTDAQQSYEDELEDFLADDAPGTGLTIESTTDYPGQDALINEFDGDSYYWGWFTDRYTTSLFANQNQRRVFLYNADNDSAAGLRNALSGSGSDRWCNVAMNTTPPYAAMAGSTSSPGTDAYLHPRPFFRYLQRGASIGEAFLASSRYLDWRMILIGDPLMVVGFPEVADDEPGDPDDGPNDGGDSPGQLPDNSLDNNQVLEKIKDRLETAISYGLRQAALTQSAVDAVVASGSIAENRNLLRGLIRWRDYRIEESRKRLLRPAVRGWVIAVKRTNSQTPSQWLSSNSQLMSPTMAEIITDVSTSTQEIDDDLIMPDGFWMYTFNYTHELDTAEFIHFRLQISAVSDFSSTVGDFNSLDNEEGWYYEFRPNLFVAMTDGFPHNFSGRRVRYRSREADYLTQLNTYYVRWRALHEDGTPITEFLDAPNKIIIKA